MSRILDRIEKQKHEDQSLIIHIYEVLTRDILTGVYPKGSKLPESMICGRFHASRTPVREAFRLLEIDGILSAIPNKGDFVRGFDEQEIQDMLVLSARAEISAAAWAAERIGEEQMDELTEVFRYAEFYTRTNDIPKMIDINQAFHIAIYQGTNDALLERRQIKYQTFASFCAPPNYFIKDYLSNVLEEHRRVFNALEHRDSEGAKMAMQFHMEKTLIRIDMSHLVKYIR